MAKVTSKLQVTRLRLFDAASLRQRDRDAEPRPASGVAARGWSREDLYDRRGARQRDQAASTFSDSHTLIRDW